MVVSLSDALALTLKTTKFSGESVPVRTMVVREGTMAVVLEEGSVIGENKG